MLDPPTDRLHKFLAVGGLGLIAIGVTVALDRYDSAEREGIEAIAAISRVTPSYEHYIEHVNEVFAEARKHNKHPTPESLAALHAWMDEREPEYQRLYQRALGENAELERLGLIAQHASKLKVIWVMIGTLLTVIGGMTSFIGFRQWMRQPARTR